MSDVSPVRTTIPLPGSQFLSAVSENWAQSMGGLANFFAYFNYSQKEFFANGNYGSAPMPQAAFDGLHVFEFNAQIIDVWAFVSLAGSSGSTTFDCLIAPASGGSWTSIFTTKPSISYLAGNYAYVGAVNPSLVGPAYSPSPSYSPPANTTQPVLNASVTNLIPAWSVMRADISAGQPGSKNAGLLIHWRLV